MNDTRMVIALENRDLKIPMEFTLIGTAHVSRGSIDEVSSIIRDEKPDLICVELDDARYASMTQKENWESLNMVKVFKESKGFLLMANLVLSGFQRRMGAELGVKPGEEMKAALDLAGELGIPYALCDREIQITLRRAWANCGFWNKNKLLATLISSAFTTEKLTPEEIENLKNRSELDGMMNELASYLPDVKHTLIDERDQYLAAKIWTSAGDLVVREQVSGEQVPAEQTPPEQSSGGKPKRRILAVVGAGHMQGIKSHLEKIAAGEESADVADLTIIPPKKILGKAVPFIISFAIIALIVSGFFKAGAKVSLSMLVNWILWNGSLSALGAILALGHPLSVLVAFVGAPIATMIPFFGPGFFSGITQVSLRKPRVVDAQSIIDDVGSLKGFYRNRITRALLVFFLSQMGGVIGKFISIPTLAGQLFRK